MGKLRSRIAQRGSRGVYYYYWRENGKEKAVSLKTTSVLVARNLKKDEDKKQKNKADMPDGPAMTVTEARESFLKLYNDKKASGYAKTVKSHLSVFFITAKITEWEDLSFSNIRKFLLQIQSTRSFSTAKRYKATISSFINEMIQHRILTENPCNAIKIHDEKKHKDKTTEAPRYLDNKLLADCLVLAKANNIYLEVFTALSTGGRLDELRKLQWKDVLWEKELIELRGKHGYRAIPLSAQLKAELVSRKERIAYDHCYNVRGDDYIFPSKKYEVVQHHMVRTGKTWTVALNRMLGIRYRSNINKKTGKAERYKIVNPPNTKLFEIFKGPVKDYNPKQPDKSVGNSWHLFRHTFATLHCNAGVDVFKVSKWLGHTDVSVTMRYTKHSHLGYDDGINSISDKLKSD